MNNILITGATGFIGENVAHSLSAYGFNVYALVRQSSNTSYLNESISCYYYNSSEKLTEFMRAKKIDIVIHVASLFIAEHNSEQVDNLIDSNIRFGTQLLEAMSQCGVRKFINTSSTWQHFNSESAEYCPTNLYAATKEAFEKIIDYYVEARGFSAITLSIFDSYGIGDRRGKFISLLDKFASEGKTLSMSGGEQQIGLTHIDDITNGYYKAVELLESTIGHKRYNLNPQEIFTLRQVIDLFESQTGKRLNIEWGARPYREREVMKAWRCGERLPNWESKIELAQALKILFSEEICE